VTPIQDLLAVLQETNALTLATLDPDGTPRATPLFFAVDPNQVSDGHLVLPFSVLFLSDPASAHSLDLARDPRASVALYPGETDWRSLRGAQMKGHAERLQGGASERALTTYRQRIPIAAELQDAVARSAVYRFSPAWARLIDNRRGFGHREEWTWP
jgi:hypothetical protein